MYSFRKFIDESVLKWFLFLVDFGKLKIKKTSLV